MFESLWLIEVQVIPVVITMFILETPNILRAFFSMPYVPIYFSLSPFNILNKDLSIYLNEDYFYQEGENLTEAELKRIRKGILIKAALSLIMSISLIPIIAGFVSGLFMPVESFLGFCLIFISYKLIGIIRAAIDFREHAICNFKSMSLYILVYCFYFICFLKLFHKAFIWVNSYISDNDWLGLISGLIDLFIIDVFFLIIITGALSTLLFLYITKIDFRNEDHH